MTFQNFKFKMDQGIPSQRIASANKFQAFLRLSAGHLQSNLYVLSDMKDFTIKHRS